MTNIKKIVALLLCVVMTLGFTACRTENESAVVYKTESGREIPVRSALYILFQIDADADYKEEYDAKATKETDTDAKETDYTKTELDGKKYNDWVEEKALEYASEFAFVEAKCAELNIELSDEQKSSVTNALTQLWDSNKKFYEKNCVAKSTLETYITIMQKQEALFDYYYGVEGKEPISDEQVKEYLTEHGILVQYLSYSKQGYNQAGETQTISDETKKEYTTVFKGYVDRLNKGEDYAKIRAEYLKKIGEEETVDTKGSTLKYPYAMYMSDEEASINPFDYYDEVAALEVNKAAFYENDGALFVMQKVDLQADMDSVLKNNASKVRHNLKDEDFDKIVEDGAKALTCEKNTSALEFYTADKLKLDQE